jgi:hypothetical protein
MKPTTFLSLIGISVLFLIAYFQFDFENEMTDTQVSAITKTNQIESVDITEIKEEEEELTFPPYADFPKINKNPIRTEQLNKRRKHCFPLDANTIALWRFNGDKETSFLNEKNNILGSFKGNPTIVEGKFGNAIHFDGIDDYGNCNFNPPEKNCTYEIWYKPDEAADKNGWVWMGWGLYNSGLIINQNDVVLCEYNAVNKRKDKLSIIPNEWNYIVYVFSDEAEKQALYINGEKVSNLQILRHESTWNSLWLAADMTYGANHFVKGTIDEFRISSNVMSEKEIKKCWRKNN